MQCGQFSEVRPPFQPGTLRINGVLIHIYIYIYMLPPPPKTYHLYVLTQKNPVEPVTAEAPGVLQAVDSKRETPSLIP